MSGKNIPINQSDLRDKFTFIRITTRVASALVLFTYHFPLILAMMYIKYNGKVQSSKKCT